MLTVNYLFSTSLFLLSVEHTARPFTCRPTLHVGFFVLSAFYSVAVTGRVSSAKIKRDNVNRFSHIVSRQKLFFSWRILGKYLIMYLHIEWQRALNALPFSCTGAYLACRLDKRLFFYIRLIDILTLTILQIICKFFVQYLSFRRQTNGMNHVILRIPKGVNITCIIPSGWSDAVWRTLCSNPHSQTKKPETAFHKRQFRAFSQFRPITRKQVKNDTTNLGI